MEPVEVLRGGDKVKPPTAKLNRYTPVKTQPPVVLRTRAVKMYFILVPAACQWHQIDLFHILLESIPVRELTLPCTVICSTLLTRGVWM